ncbi:MAG: hypothetical protein U1U88_000742 [Lawsonella clevelandensis]
MAGAGGMALPGTTFDLELATRILIAVSCIVVTLVFCHLSAPLRSNKSLSQP